MCLTQDFNHMRTHMFPEKQQVGISPVWTGLWRNQKHFKGPTVVVGVAQRPGLVRVEVRVSSDASAGEVGVGQESPLSVERGAVTMETRGKEDHDVCLLTLVLDLWVRHLLNGIRYQQNKVKTRRNNEAATRKNNRYHLRIYSERLTEQKPTRVNVVNDVKSVKEAKYQSGSVCSYWLPQLFFPTFILCLLHQLWFMTLRMHELHQRRSHKSIVWDQTRGRKHTDLCINVKLKCL